MPPIKGFPPHVNINYLNVDIDTLLKFNFGSYAFIKLSDIEEAYNKTFPSDNFANALSVVNLTEDYIFEFVKKYYPKDFMAVPRPAEIPGILRKGVLDMKAPLNFPFGPQAIEEGFNKDGRETPAGQKSYPIVEEVVDDLEPETIHLDTHPILANEDFERIKNKAQQKIPLMHMGNWNKVREPHIEQKKEGKEFSFKLNKKISPQPEPTTILLQPEPLTISPQPGASTIIKGPPPGIVVPMTSSTKAQSIIKKNVTPPPGFSSTLENISQNLTRPPGLTISPSKIVDKMLKDSVQKECVNNDDNRALKENDSENRFPNKVKQVKGDVSGLEKMNLQSENKVEDKASLNQMVDVEKSNEEGDNYEEFFDSDYLAEDPTIANFLETESDIVPIDNEQTLDENVTDTNDQQFNENVEENIEFHDSAPGFITNQEMLFADATESFEVDTALDKIEEDSPALEFFSADFIAQLNSSKSSSNPSTSENYQDAMEGEIESEDEIPVAPVISQSRIKINYNELSDYNEFIDPEFLGSQHQGQLEAVEEANEDDGADEFFDQIILNNQFEQRNLNGDLDAGEIREFSTNSSHSHIQMVDPLNRPKVHYIVQNGVIFNYRYINALHQSITERVYIPNENNSAQREKWQKLIDNCASILRLVQKAHFMHPAITTENWLHIQEEFDRCHYYLPNYSVNIASLLDLIRLDLLKENYGNVRCFIANREVIFMRFFPLPRNLASNLYRLLCKSNTQLTIGSIASYYDQMGGVVKAGSTPEEMIIEVVNEFPEIFFLESKDHKNNLKSATIKLNDRINERDICLDFSAYSL